MAVNKRLLQGAAGAAGGLVPSEHFGVVLYEGDGSTSHSINGGKFGAGAYFNGGSSIDTGISTTNFVSDLNDRTVDFSFSFWTQIHSYPQGDNTIFYIGNYNVYSPSYAAIILDFRSASKKIRFTHQTQYIESTSTFNAPMTTWVHVAAIRDNSVLKLYINGSLEASVTLTADTQVSSSTTLDIGGFQFGSGTVYSGLEGKIDQVRIFTKALSSSEVSTLYAETVETVESLDPLSEDTTDTLQVLGDSSCIATYRFENDETDLSGNYDGTGTEIQYAAGRYGQAASFNGSSSGIDLPNLGISGSQSRTVSFWFNLNTTPSGTEQLYSQGTNNLKEAFNIQLTSSAKVQVSYAGREWDSTTALSTGQWYHILVTYNGGNIETSSNTEIYINGTEETLVSGGGSSTGSASTSNTSYSLGYRTNISTLYVDGKMDQVRLFNKTLSASEVTTLYQENSLVASYRFEGNANDDMRAYDGTATNVTYEYGLGFTPDFVWLKGRTSTDNHSIYDNSRTIGNPIYPNLTNAESSPTDKHIDSFDTGGFTLGRTNIFNSSGQDYVAWCLKANGGTTASGSGTGGVSNVTTQVNSQAGFSIINFTEGTGTSSSVNHGLDATPDLIITRRRTMGGAWMVWHNALSGSQYLRLNETNAVASSTNVWNGTAPNATSVSLGPWLTESDDYGPQKRIMYAFHSVEGFSKFGSYTGNGSTSNIIETGFEPAFLTIKKTSAASGSWWMVDNKRSQTNPRNERLVADQNYSEVEYTPANLNFLSNGFELQGNYQGTNESGQTYIYMAFAADPDTEAPTVAKSFFTTTYDGTGADGNSITGFGFKPGLLWLKRRNSTADHWLFDIVRGPFKLLESSTSDAENNRTTSVASFDDDGFTIDNDTAYNNTSDDYISWAWKADDNEATINTEGSIDSLVSANANAGFSIVKYTGNGANGTVGHGLSAAPEMIIAKSTSDAYEWKIWHKDLSSGYQILFNGAAQASDSSVWTTTTPTSTVFSVGTNVGVNQSAKDYIAYCFHSVSNYSKIGSYSGTGSSGNSITGLGFQPDWIMIKRTDSAGLWCLLDSVRGTTQFLSAEQSSAEQTISSAITFTSNGFTLTDTSANRNASGGTYMYMAFKIN